MEAILSRRSIRSYTSEKVSEEQINKLLEAAMAAPSARNLQPWHFVVTTNSAVLKALAEAHPYGKMLSSAGCAIAVCGDPRMSEAYWVQDCSAATENILIAVSSLGLGAVWLGVSPRDDRNQAIQSVLKIPEEYPVLSLISIGHPDETPRPKITFDPAKIHRDKW